LAARTGWINSYRQHMSDYGKTFTAACIQAEPVWFDLPGAVEKTIALIEQAADRGAAIIAFPETCEVPPRSWRVAYAA